MAILCAKMAKAKIWRGAGEMAAWRISSSLSKAENIYRGQLHIYQPAENES
jgi:hypothetical protein